MLPVATGQDTAPAERDFKLPRVDATDTKALERTLDETVVCHQVEAPLAELGTDGAFLGLGAGEGGEASGYGFGG